MKETSILIKPASSTCNAVCTYCFYDDVSDCRTVKSHGLIAQETWQKLVDDAYTSPEGYDKITFLFQGGEPLLAGYKFFSEFINYTQNHKGAIDVHYAVQTNGTRLSDRICKLLKDNNFLVGISIDGFQENHDRFRMLHGKGSFESVMDGLALLRKYDIPYNVLTVLTKQLAKSPERLYQFYKEQQFEFVQIIPCMPSFSNTVYEDPFACTPESFDSFYRDFFELWMADFAKGDYMSEGLIDDAIRVLSGVQPIRCGMMGQCQSQCIVESNGSIYPCDFYVLDDYEAGNINKTKLNDILAHPVMESFKYDHQDYPKSCLSCPFVDICRGNCKRLRANFAGDDLCGYQNLLSQIQPKIPQIHAILNSLGS